MLRQSDGYLSGQQLCDHFQVSRTAVWKAINQLKEEGYEIEAVRNKGYRIVDIPDRITADAIKSCLETKWMAKNLEYYDEIDSTNNRAKALGEAGGADGTLFVAETQTAGKGRRGRCWQSPVNPGIIFINFMCQKIVNHRFFFYIIQICDQTGSLIYVGPECLFDHMA